MITNMASERSSNVIRICTNGNYVQKYITKCYNCYFIVLVVVVKLIEKSEGKWAS